MIPLEVRRQDGSIKQIDMTLLTRLAKGTGEIRTVRRATLAFSTEIDAFVGLSSAAPDIRGNSEGDSYGVSDEYVGRVYR